MSNLVPSGGSEFLSPRQVRAMTRQLARSDVHAEVRIRSIENEADVAASKAETVGYVGKRAMFVIGSVTQAEQQLGQMFPMAVTRLQAIGDVVAFAAAEIVADTQMKLRRS